MKSRSVSAEPPTNEFGAERTHPRHLQVTEERTDMVSIDSRRFLVGARRELSAVYAGVALGVGLLSFVLFATLPALRIVLPVDFHLYLLSIMLLAASIQAYLNRGFLVSVLLAVTPALGYFEAISVFRLAGPVHLSVLGAVGSSLLFGVPAGAIGFLVGSGLGIAVDRVLAV